MSKNTENQTIYKYPPPFKGLIALGHQRLSIVGLQSGKQPIQVNLKNGFTLSLAVNGEIYNYKEIREKLYQMERQNHITKLFVQRKEKQYENTQITLDFETEMKEIEEKHKQLLLECENEVNQMNQSDYSSYQYITDSDCESISHLFCAMVDFIDTSKTMTSIQSFYQNNQLNEFIQSRLDMLDGIFAFVLTITHPHLKQPFFLISRDPIGVNSLYYGLTKDDEVMVASEMKALHSKCSMVADMLPGHFIAGDVGNEILEPIRYYFPKWDMDLGERNNSLDFLIPEIRNTLTNAVRKQLMSEVPSGVLLSGGLDSSLIASIACRELKKMGNTEWGNRLRTFSIGLNNSPDLEKAKEVADFLGTSHHSFTFTLEEGFDAIKDVIYHLETYDITTIRASTPMFLLSRKIKAFGVKMVLSGEGSDEILGGYLYFHHAPNNHEFLEECKSRVKALYKADCLRANKSTMAWGLEVRVPFLDKDFLELAIPIDSDVKMRQKDNVGKRVEKWVLRKAFDTPDNPYLPDSLLWRQKEQFSDGVGYNWIDTLIEKTNNMVSSREMSMASLIFPFQTPTTKEGFYYRKIFDELFPHMEHLTSKWVPRTDWNGVKSSDPSGRVYDIHENKKN